MAYPFRSEIQALRQQLLLAVGSGGALSLAAFGCGSTHGPMQPPVGNQPVPRVEAGRGGSTAASGASGQATNMGAAGSAGTTTVVLPMCSSSQVVRSCYSREQMENKARYGCGQAPKSPTPTDAEVTAAFLQNGCLPKQMACDGCCNPATAEGQPQTDGTRCYVHCAGACCGRPLIVAGESRLAGVEPRADWLALETLSIRGAAAPDRAFRERIASEWREDARMEHASIASFARFTLELLAFGADSELVALAQRAALDEVEHARLCFALAEGFDGRALGPAPLELTDVQPAATLRAAARAAFVEGGNGETQAALLARAALARATDPAARVALERIADDEARHAELAYRFVSLALRREPELRAELSAALQEAVAAVQPVRVEDESDELRDALHAAGRLTAKERAAAMRDALNEVIAPCTRAMIGSGCDSEALPVVA